MKTQNALALTLYGIVFIGLSAANRPGEEIKKPLARYETSQAFSFESQSGR